MVTPESVCVSACDDELQVYGEHRRGRRLVSLYLPHLSGCLGVGLQCFLYYDFSVLLAGFHMFTNQ